MLITTAQLSVHYLVDHHEISSTLAICSHTQSSLLRMPQRPIGRWGVYASVSASNREGGASIYTLRPKYQPHTLTSSKHLFPGCGGFIKTP